MPRPGKKLKAESRIYSVRRVIKSLSAKNRTVLDEMAAALSEKLRILEETVKTYSTPTENGYPVLEDKDRKKLTALYSDAVAQCAYILSFKDQKGFAENRQYSALAEMVEKSRRFLLSDVRALRAVHTKIGATLPEALENSRSFVVNIDDINIKPATGGAMSSRLPISVTTASGHKFDGMFTLDSSFDLFDVMERSNTIIQKLIDMTPAASTKEFLSQYVLKEEDVYQKPLRLSRLISFMQGVRKGVSMDELSKAIGKEGLFYEKGRSFGGEIHRKLEDYLKEIAPEADKLEGSMLMNLSRLKLKSGSNVDRRNTAMSIVADLLGRSDLIANAVTMKVKCNGREYTGTFMEYVKGTSDVLHLKENDPFFECSIRTGISGRKVLKDMADLQVIDYICGNVDRHRGNMLYSFGKTKGGETYLKGIKAIDNDASFGRREIGKGLNRLAGISRMKVISESMKDRIEKLDGESLKLALKQTGLSDEEIAGSIQRLDEVKKAVKEHEIRVVKDEQWENLDIKKLAATEDKPTINGSGVFREVVDAFNPNNTKILKEWSKKNGALASGKKAALEDSGKAFTLNENERTKASQAIDKVVTDLTAVKNVWFGSGKYTDMLTSAKALQKGLSENCSNEDFKKLAEDLRDKTEIYLDRKFTQSADKANRTNSINRILAANSAVDFTQKYLDKVELSEWDEYRLQNKDYNLQLYAKKQFEKNRVRQNDAPQNSGAGKGIVQPKLV